MQRKHVLAIAPIAVLCACAPSLAQGSESGQILTPTAPPPGCTIGVAESPQCALATFIACVVRRDTGLCKIVGIAEPCLHPTATSARYVIDGVAPAEERHLPKSLREARHKGLEFSTIEFRHKICAPEEPSCDVPERSTTGIAMFATAQQRWFFPLPPFTPDRCLATD